MTGAELKSLAEEIYDGQVEWSDDHFYQLLNIAKTKLEELTLWQFLKKLDSSNSASSSPIILPTDFAEDYKVQVGLQTEYTPVPFEDYPKYRNSSNYYYIDWAALTINLLGNNILGTLYLYYKRFTPDITADTEPVFPKRFHPLLAYYVVAVYQTGTDNDDLMTRMSPANKQAALELERAMKAWNSSIAMRAQNNQVGMINTSSSNEIPLSQM